MNKELCRKVGEVGQDNLIAKLFSSGYSALSSSGVFAIKVPPLLPGLAGVLFISAAVAGENMGIWMLAGRGLPGVAHTGCPPVRIHSAGGNAYDAITIHNRLKELPAEIGAVIPGCAGLCRPPLNKLLITLIFLVLLVLRLLLGCRAALSLCAQPTRSRSTRPVW